MGINHCNTPERHPGGYTRVIHPRGTLVGIPVLYTPERHPGGYVQPIIHTQEAPWWVYIASLIHPRGTLVGIASLIHPVTLRYTRVYASLPYLGGILLYMPPCRA